MGWGLTTEIKNTDSTKTGNENMYGTRSPNVSDQYTGAFNDFKRSLNPAGLNPTQQTGLDRITTAATTGAAQNRTGMENVNGYIMGRGSLLNPMASSPTAHTATASTSANAPLINAKTGADSMGAYKELYDKELIDPLMADYDNQTDVSRNALRAGNAGSFANKRFGVAEGQFGSDALRGRSTLKANLLTDRIKTAADLGQQDSNRFLSADTSNAGNLLSNNQFNAATATDVSKFNAGAADRADQRQLDAVAQQTGIAQEMLKNVFTVNGFDMEAAQSLFAAGSISQAQLQQIMDAAGAYNGSSFTQNTDSRSNTNTTEVGAKASFGV